MLAAACADPVLVLGPGPATGGAEADDRASEAPASTDPVIPDVPPGSCDGDGACQNKIDLLFVIDNSGTMAEEQLNLAENFPMLIEQLEQLEDRHGNRVGADVNVMVTTTDLGNPLCESFSKPDYQAAKGSPIWTPCTSRLARFSGFGADPLVVETACTQVCDPTHPAQPTDHFIHFDRHGSNVIDGTPGRALACLGPQGIDGCGYESPLEAMVQALNPSACWNAPDQCTKPQWSWIDKPFLRDDAVLAIAIITDETDCSVRDYSIMGDADFQAVNPRFGQHAPSSSICWNAGVVCGDLNPETGEYSGCVATNKDADGTIGVPDDEAVLHPVSRYVDMLRMFRGQGREVIMLGVLGVPEVTAHANVPPFQPTQGGVEALVYRRWRDPAVSAGGDILPGEWDAGTRAADKEFEFGIGPGCTSYDAANATSAGQAIPPVRIRSVCESLNVLDDPETPADEGRVRCCIESICDADFSPAIRCLTGLIQDAFVPEG